MNEQRELPRETRQRILGDSGNPTSQEFPKDTHGRAHCGVAISDLILLRGV